MIDGVKTKIIDLTGNIYGKLIVTNFAYRKRSGKNYKYYWACQCDCGEVCTVESNNNKIFCIYHIFFYYLFICHF